MSLSVQWTDESYKICEECLGLVQLPDTMADTIFNLIKDVLIRCSLPLSQCRGQAFDGAAGGMQSISDERRKSCIVCSLFSTQPQVMSSECCKKL